MVSIKQSKFIKSLKIKKYRLRENCFIIEGRKNVLEAVKSDCKFKYILGTNEFLEAYGSELEAGSFHVIRSSPEELIELGTFQVNNDCLAVAEIPDYASNISFDDHIFLLDGISDPGNLGTIVRTLDWFGFDQLVCSPSSADFYNPKVINATMGSFMRVKVFYQELGDFIQSSPLDAFGADLGGTHLHEWKSEMPSLIVMGSESHGISEELKKLLKGSFTIARRGNAESLNVGIATGIISNHLRTNH